MKPFLNLLFICLCFLQGEAQLFTKERLINNENFDKAKLSYGYFLGFNNYDFNIDYKTDVEDIQVIKSTGFNVGLIGNIRINDYFDIRLEPGLVMSNRTLSYSGTYFEGLIYEEKGEFLNAEIYFNKCLSMTGFDYERGIHQQAKSGLVRILD